jgi:hypothetical protein
LLIHTRTRGHDGYIRLDRSKGVDKNPNDTVREARYPNILLHESPDPSHLCDVTFPLRSSSPSLREFREFLHIFLGRSPKYTNTEHCYWFSGSIMGIMKNVYFGKLWPGTEFGKTGRLVGSCGPCKGKSKAADIETDFKRHLERIGSAPQRQPAHVERQRPDSRFSEFHTQGRTYERPSSGASQHYATGYTHHATSSHPPNGWFDTFQQHSPRANSNYYSGSAGGHQYRDYNGSFGRSEYESDTSYAIRPRVRITWLGGRVHTTTSMCYQDTLNVVRFPYLSSVTATPNITIGITDSILTVISEPAISTFDLSTAGSFPQWGF